MEKYCIAQKKRELLIYVIKIHVIEKVIKI